MSYILDALKKSQAEQLPGGYGLDLATPPPPRSRTGLWLAVAAVALTVNVAFFAWYLLSRDASGDSVAMPQPAPPTTTPAPTTPNTAPAPTAAPANPEPTLPRRVATEPVSASQSNAVPARTPTRTPDTLPLVRLSDLSRAEQTLYNGFSYTSHIFTDDPSLCAVVIDGQRLQAGDAFKGLKVVEITETGVVFEEQRRGQRRRVAVTPFE